MAGLKGEDLDDQDKLPLCHLYLMLPLQRVGFVIRKPSSKQLIQKLHQWADHMDPVSMYRTKPQCYDFNETVRASRRLKERGGWKYETVEEPAFNFDQIKCITLLENRDHVRTEDLTPRSRHSMSGSIKMHD